MISDPHLQISETRLSVGRPFARTVSEQPRFNLMMTKCQSQPINPTVLIFSGPTLSSCLPAACLPNQILITERRVVVNAMNIGSRQNGCTPLVTVACLNGEGQSTCKASFLHIKMGGRHHGPFLCNEATVLLRMGQIVILKITSLHV